MKAQDKFLDEVFKDSGEMFDGKDFRDDHAPITFWIPKTKKVLFDRLQIETKRKFGKKLKDVIVIAIDKVRLKGA